MGKVSTRATLAANLAALMNAPNSKYKTAQAVETATQIAGTKVGRSSVQRILEQQTPVNIDFIEVLAKIFKVEPWQLLADQLGQRAAADPSLGEALAALSKQLARVPVTFQKSAAALLENLVVAPRTHARVLTALQSLVEASDDLVVPEDDDPPFELEADGPKATPPVQKGKRSGGRVKAPIYYGDGNKRQVKLPFPIKSLAELKSAVPGESEARLWRAIEEYPKAKA